MEYINISTTFQYHHKTKKLQRSLKDHGIFCLLQLWTIVAVEKPSGVLSSWNIEDIEDKANFKGIPRHFVSELLRIRFLDEYDGLYAIHNWLDYNPLPKWPTMGRRPCTKTWIKIKANIFKRDKYICQYCGQYVEKPECDHIKPICRGGSNEPINLTTACPSCNRKKGSKSLEEWVQ